MRLRVCRIVTFSVAFLTFATAFLPASADAASRAAKAAAGQPSSPPAPPPPTITSTGKNVYLDGVATNFVGTPGQFTFSDAGTVTGYIFGFDSVVVGPPAPAGHDGTLTLSITPNNVAELDLYVQAVNGSSPPSSPTLFRIDTGLPPGNVASLAWWKLNAARGGLATDSTGHDHAAALSKGQFVSCAGVQAPDGARCALTLNGQGDAQTSSALLPIVGTRSSFTASTWLELNACRATCIALSQGGAQSGAFALGFQANCARSKHGCWVFTLRISDTVEIAMAPVGRQTPFGRWVQLTAEFDATRGGVLTLYVNGAQKASATAGAVPSSNSGIVRLGAGAGGSDRWRGRLSNACLFFGPVPPAGVTTLYKGNAAHPRNGCAALFAKYP
jgi:Concanavalin A-like lectin/glucanases superfamily